MNMGGLSIGLLQTLDLFDSFLLLTPQLSQTLLNGIGHMVNSICPTG